MILGAIESGKSTICQQIKLYCKERPHEIEISHRPAYIYDFLFISMDRLLKLMQSMQISFADSENEVKFVYVNEEYRECYKKRDKKQCKNPI